MGPAGRQLHLRRQVQLSYYEGGRAQNLGRRSQSSTAFKVNSQMGKLGSGAGVTPQVTSSFVTHPLPSA